MKRKNDENVVCGADNNVSSPQVSVEETITMLRRQVAGYQGYIKKLHAKIDELRGLVKECEDLAIKRTGYVKKLEKELNDARLEVERLNNELNIERSLPWYRRIFI